MRFSHPASLPIVLLTAALFMPACAFAIDAPARKSGLWEIKIENTGSGQKTPGPMTMQICVDQKKDNLTADSKEMQNAQKQCSKMNTTRTGNRVVVDSVCKFNQHTVIGHTVVTGDMNSHYRMENTSRFDPPMHGMQTASSTMSGKWLGACKPGQQHGAMIMPGMGANGGFKIDPEMMKRLQKMQQQ